MTGAGATMQPLVTAVIIFKNPGEYLDPAIRSVLAQTYANWELILVDDGSTDVGTEIARRFAAEHPERIRYVDFPNHENRGMSAARNLGIREGRGEYVAFLDADDIWTPDKLEHQVGLMLRHPRVAMVYGPLKMWHSWTGRPEDANADYMQSLGLELEQVVEPPTVVNLFLADGDFLPSGALFKKSALEEVGMCEESFRTLYEDQVLHTKVELAFPVYATGHCGYWYRQHPAGCCLTAEAAGIRRAPRRRFLEWVEQYMRRQPGHATRETWRILRKELRLVRHPKIYALLAAPGFRWISPALKAARNLLSPRRFEAPGGAR